MKTKRWIGLMIGVAVVAAAAMSSTVNAQTTKVTAEATSPDDWHFMMPVGLYSFSVEGPVAVGNLSGELDLDSGDVSDKLDQAAGVAVEFGKGKWTGLTSAKFLKFEGDWRDVPALPLVEATGTVLIKPTLKWSTLQGAVAYRAVWIDREPGKAFIFEPVGGLRFTKLEGTVENVAGTERSRDVTWTDLFVGFRLSKAFTPHLGLSFSGDYGVGVSGNSKPSWNCSTALGWRFPFDGWAMTAAVGYTAGGVQFEDKKGDTQSALAMDITTQGPTLGVAFSW